MNSPELLKAKALENAAALIELYDKAARGEATFMNTIPEAREQMWDLIKQLILQADDLVNIPDLSKGTISDRVDLIMGTVAEGGLTIKQGKRLIEMLQAGFEITELPKLIEALAKVKDDE